MCPEVEQHASARDTCRFEKTKPLSYCVFSNGGVSGGDGKNQVSCKLASWKLNNIYIYIYYVQRVAKVALVGNDSQTRRELVERTRAIRHVPKPRVSLRASTFLGLEQTRTVVSLTYWRLSDTPSYYLTGETRQKRV